jgi:hypothetical protein
MNVLLLISGLVAGFCTVGHFMVGSKSYLKPLLQASFDDVAKNVMHCVFHYVSVFLVLTSITLLLLGFGIGFNLPQGLKGLCSRCFNGRFLSSLQYLPGWERLEKTLGYALPKS